MSTGTLCLTCRKFVRLRQDTELCPNCEMGFFEEIEIPKRRYEVFLSFRGDDTRASFTSHLHYALQNAGITVFMDDDLLERGDHISTSLVRAIEGSQISIVVFSTNYADSRWCLEELENIMTCHRTQGQVVLPVFYRVDPSEVRHQKGDFGTAFQNLLSKISEKNLLSKILEKEHKWRRELREAADFAGFVVLNSGNESEDIKNMVEKVTHLLDKTILFVAKNPVGVESRVQDIIQLLDLDNKHSDDALLVGICCMGGMGKTTIATAIYNKIGRNFEGRSFIANIREVWEKNNGQVDLQKQLLFDIFKGKTTTIQSIASGKHILKERLRHKRVLLVLDDINKFEQLDALCGSPNWFGSGSRIIITTRDRSILRGTVQNEKVYEMKEMNERESIELFSWHAFKQERPRENLAEISSSIVKYCGGLPLALEVLGRYLFEKEEVTYWNLVLKKLRSIPNKEVHEKLKISFDGLSDDYQKEIFLDIACFFIGMDRSDVMHILDGCDLHAGIGISDLIERSLVTVDDKNMLGMHDLLRDMGREIIRKNSPNELELELGERSRLWSSTDVRDVLSEQTGTRAVKGLAFKLPKDNTECFSTEAFKEMKRLRLLQLSNVKLNGDFKYLSKKLRWLSWNGFPLTSIPTRFYQGNLVSIALENSNVRFVWKETQRMEMLKILNLSHSHYLTKTPDFSNMPNLEKLVLTDCRSLSEVSSSIGHLDKVLLINLEDCVSLHNLPRSIYKLKSLKTLILSGCKRIDKLEEDLEQMESLTTLIANNTAITRVPFAVVRSKIAYISLCGYEGFSCVVFPSIILSWMSPTNNLSSLFQTPTAMSSLVPFNVQHRSSDKLSSTSEYLPTLGSHRVECGSEIQLNTKELESTATTSQALKNSSEHLLFQVGMNCDVANILKENILQNMTVDVCGDFSLPDDSYPNWLTFSWEGSCVSFEVPQVEGRNLKTMMMCIAFSSTPHNTTSNCLKYMLVHNYAKATFQIYEGEALASLEDEEGQRVVSSMEPGNKVEVVFVFENGFIVIKTTIYLIYDENECVVSRISPQPQPMDDSVGTDSCCGLMQCSFRQWITGFMCRLLSCWGTST